MPKMLDVETEGEDLGCGVRRAPLPLCLESWDISKNSEEEELRVCREGNDGRDFKGWAKRLQKKF